MAPKKKSLELLTRKEKRSFIIYTLLILFGFFLGINLNMAQGLSLIKLPKMSIPGKLGAGEVISAKELKKTLENKDFALINVHTPYEGEIKNTDSFVEYDSMKANENKLPKDKSASIVLYCKSGSMSAKALQTLKSMGYTNVSHLAGGMKAWEKAGYNVLDLSSLPEQVLPKEGYKLPISWGNIGPRLIELGVIDLVKLEKTMQLTDEQKEILTKGSDSIIKITQENSRFIVNMLWALGLAQKSKVYEDGPMGTEYKDRLGNFASTGGWTLAKGEAVNYLNKFDLIPLTSNQQELVAEIAKNVYRPCCGNSTWFPDCNHGMAALAAIELMVSAGVSEAEIYKNLLAINSFWFPSTYLTSATYFARQGIAWGDVDAKLVLGQEYSSSQGAQELYQKVGDLPFEGAIGGGCGA